MNGQPGLPRCQHGVWIVPADWSLQAAHGIPASKRVAWHCFVCRDCGAGEFSEEKLLELARANANRALKIEFVAAIACLRQRFGA